ncbi:MAG: DUF47 family protein [Firmicutes bacterium]|nr:DUF47 family protein [Bacillota bacterium]
MDLVLKCHEEFVAAIEILFTDKRKFKIETLAARISALESKADDERHSIIKTLLGGALLPESRGEILKLIELTDEVANKSEELITQICLENITFYDEMKTCIIDINNKTREQFLLLRNIINTLFTGYDILENYKIIQKTELIESEVDKLEESLIKELYSMDINLVEMNQLRNIISKYPIHPIL